MRLSPLQNRVLPTGEIVAIPERGTLMGNRGGRLHDDARRLRRVTAGRAWICCELAFRGRQRAVMGPGYTELFFLDEATALAAGHRPCFECRRAEAVAFAVAFGNGQRVRAPEVDRALRSATPARLPEMSLPSGAMTMHHGACWLITDGKALRWAPGGYAETRELCGDADVLTLPPILGALARGYRPRLHQSARFQG